MQLFKLKCVRLLGKAKAGTKRAPSSIETARRTDSVPETFAQGDSLADNASLTSSRWDEFCEKYDQWPREIHNMHISNILYHMVKMQEHHWRLLEQHDKDKTSNKREFPRPVQIWMVLIQLSMAP